METADRKAHWEKVYTTKSSTELSWYQPTPATSIGFLQQLHIPLTAKIMDVGGGDSLLVDHLVALGYTDITVLDISSTAIEKAKQRLGDKARRVKWMVSDVLHFQAAEQYDFWHDRATFHFLLDEKEIDRYLETAAQSLTPNGIMVLGTFAEDGPETCSGLKIHRYSEDWMTDRLRAFFQKIKCIRMDHLTPARKVQHFIFCSFRKLRAA